MDRENLYLRWLGAVSIAALALAAVMWLTGVQVQSNGEEDAGAAQFAVAGALLQLGSIAGLLWLTARGILAHFPSAPSPQRTLADVERDQRDAGS